MNDANPPGADYALKPKERQGDTASQSSSSRAWLESTAPLGPRSITVLVDVSNRCNIRCRMCYFSFDSVFHRRSEFLTPSDFRTVASRLFPNAHTVYLSAGSEPMTSPHFPEILQIASGYDIQDLKFLSNGLLMTEEIAEAILAAGVNQIHFSVDGACKETYEDIRVGGRFDVLLKNIRYLSKRKRELGTSKPILQFNVTLMRSNLNELCQFVDLAEDLGVERIAARHVMPYEGLDIEDEALSHRTGEANSRFRDFFDRIAESETVTLVEFPDLFAEASQESKPIPSQPLTYFKGSKLQQQDLQIDGSFDFPREDNVRCDSEVELSGWCLHANGTASAIEICREATDEDPPVTRNDVGLVSLGQAKAIPGARPDVAVLHPGNPSRFHNAWTFVLKKEHLAGVEEGPTQIYAIARNAQGGWRELGRRWLEFGEDENPLPFVFCKKPFENVYVDSSGKIYPYPDCQTVDPFGDALAVDSFKDIWYGEAFSELRQAIIDGEPPPMCAACPNFINRNVDDPAYFDEREVESSFRLPKGFVESPVAKHFAYTPGIALEGWAFGFEEFEGVQILRSSVPGEIQPWISLGQAKFREEGRPDVVGHYKYHARNKRPKWAFSFALGDFPLFNRGYDIRIVARNKDGGKTVIGSRTMDIPQSATRGHLEKLTERAGQIRVTGWLLFEDGPADECVLTNFDGQSFAAKPWRRHDVAKNHPEVDNSLASGFTVTWDVSHLSPDETIQVQLVAKRGERTYLFPLNIPRNLQFRGSAPLREREAISPDQLGANP